MTVELERFKGQFVRDKPKKIKTPKDPDLILYSPNAVKQCGLKINGWIQPIKGAL